MIESPHSNEDRQLALEIEDSLGIGVSCVESGYIGDTGITVGLYNGETDPSEVERRFKFGARAFISDLITDYDITQASDIFVIDSSSGFVQAVTRYPEEFVAELHTKKTIFIREFHDSSSNDIKLGEIYDLLTNLLELQGDEYASARVSEYIELIYGVKITDRAHLESGVLDMPITLQGFATAAAHFLGKPITGIAYVDTGEEDTPHFHKGHFSRFYNFSPKREPREWSADVLSINSSDLTGMISLPQWASEKVRAYASQFIATVGLSGDEVVIYEDVDGMGVDIEILYHKQEDSDYPIITFSTKRQFKRSCSSGDVQQTEIVGFRIDCNTGLITAIGQEYNFGDSTVTSEQLSAFVQHPGVKLPFHPNGSNSNLKPEINPFAGYSLGELMRIQNLFATQVRSVEDILKMRPEDIEELMGDVIKNASTQPEPVELPQYRVDDTWPSHSMKRNDLPWLVTHIMVLLDLATLGNI